MPRSAHHPSFSDIIAPITVSADASDVLSGTRNYDFYREYQSEGYTLYFNVKDSNVRTASVTGCYTTKASTNITIPDTARFRGVDYTITEIAHSAFKNQENMTSIYIPKNVTKIETNAFCGCTNCSFSFNQINGNGDYLLKEIGGSAFKNCVNLNSLTFVKNVTTIGRDAFTGCSGLTYVIAPNLVSMGKRAFADCGNIYCIDLSGSSLTEIPEGAFKYCNTSNVDKCTIKLPSTLTSIGKEAFYNVKGLRSIYLENVSTIGDSAFENCHKLQAVLTTEALTSIGSKAFCGCDPMKYFVCKNDNVTIGDQALGYDCMRNYQGKKTNFTLWGNSSNTSVKRYADANGMTYRNTSEAAALASARYVDYEWALPNLDTYWSNTWKYYFNDAHRPYVKNYGEKFEGVCAGMAAVSALTSSGYLSVSDYAPGYSKIPDIKYGGSYIPSNTKSYVTTVWSNFPLNHTYDYCTSGLTFDKEMLLYAENITYGADAAVFCTGKHAMVCFGMEFKKDAADKNAPCWTGWDARLLIYDVNNSMSKEGIAHDPKDYVYVRFSDGSCSHNFPAIYDPYQFTMTFTPDNMVSSNEASTFFQAIRVQS
ncbi:MAG: leucine-rich repeat domain-containing protein [Ruminococcus sp.]|nr:leucine-rich repeat domain-containing protein [Ruminococcus sp.]